MRVVITLVLCAVLSIGVNAQKKNKSNDEPVITIENKSFDQEFEVYKTSLKYLDYDVAINSVYSMMAIDPDRTDLLDSLAFLYYLKGSYVQCVLIGDDILASSPENQGILEITAVSKQNLGLIKESLENYETLYSLTKREFHLYQVATLQYQLKRYGECIGSLDAIIASPASSSTQVSINAGKNKQEIPLDAAAYNMKGVISMEVNQLDAAESNLKKALELSPDFVLAKGNLDQVDRLRSSKPATD